MKRKIALLLVGAMVLTTMPMTALAADVNLTFNGAAIKSDQAPMIINGRTMVPVRAIAESLGVEVSWDDSTKTATFTKDKETVKIIIGENKLTYNDGEKDTMVDLDSPATIMNNRTLVPLSAIAKCFDCIVTWDGDTKTADINTNFKSDIPTDDKTTGVSVDLNEQKMGIKNYAEQMDSSLSILMNVVDQFSESEMTEYETQCKKLSTVLKETTTESMGLESLEACYDTLNDAYGVFYGLADKYGLGDEYLKAFSGVEE